MTDRPWWSFLNMVSRTSTVWAASTGRWRMHCRPIPPSVQKLSVPGASEDWTSLRLIRCCPLPRLWASVGMR